MTYLRTAIATAALAAVLAPAAAAAPATVHREAPMHVTAGESAFARSAGPLLSESDLPYLNVVVYADDDRLERFGPIVNERGGCRMRFRGAGVRVRIAVPCHAPHRLRIFAVARRDVYVSVRWVNEAE